MSIRLAELYRTAFVTGASSGLGGAFAEMLLAEGLLVWGTARDVARLNALAERHAGSFFPVALDLATPEAAGRAWAEAEHAAGGFDLVINNAGYGVFGAFDEQPFKIWQAQLEAMLTGTMRLAHAALGGFRARHRGCLVNVSSLAVEFPLPYMSGYNVVKAGLSAFSESLMAEARGGQFIVIDFRPGDYRTAFNAVMRPAGPTQKKHGPQQVQAWRALEAHLAAAPAPERAAADLRRALLRRRSGTVRSGSFFQARMAPFLNRLVPGRCRRWVAAVYFGLR